MTAFLVLGCILGYVLTATVATPTFYRRLRPIVPNNLSYAAPGTTAKWYSIWMGLFWPLGIFAFVVTVAMRNADKQYELDRNERAELDKFGKRAMKELDSL